MRRSGPRRGGGGKWARRGEHRSPGGLYYADHQPPHFHARYGGDEALVTIDTLLLLRGSLPRRALALVLEWASLHRDELRNDWDRARQGLPLAAIPPLD